MSSKSLRTLFAPVVLLAACSAAPVSDSAGWPLEGVYWKLVALRGQPVAASALGREAHLLLQTDGARMAGSAGCNRLAGSYARDGAALRFGSVAGTRMMCPTGMDTEAAFLASLGVVAAWRVEADRLQLRDAGGATVAEFSAGSQRYACDGGSTVFVHYDNTLGPQRSEAWLTFEGKDHRLRAAPSASGARYSVDAGRAPGLGLEWRTQGAEGLLREGPSSSGVETWTTIARCRQI